VTRIGTAAVPRTSGRPRNNKAQSSGTTPPTIMAACQPIWSVAMPAANTPSAEPTA
jgi:hypothetical protein